MKMLSFIKLFPLREPGRRPWLFGGAVLLLGGLLWLACHARAGTAELPPEITPSAAVVKVVREDLCRELTIPAEFRPYAEVALHAKVSGYVRQVNVDIGDRVKAGQVLATLEVPELQDELHNAEAAWQKAGADFTNANLIYTRLVAVNRSHPNLVAQQDLDTAGANAQSAAAAIAAAQANVDKLHTLADYTKIVAPFDGVVTHRYADPGALIQAGTASDTQAMPLVRVSDNYRLRLDFPVTVDYVKDIETGAAVAVRVDSLDGQTLAGRITRFARSVDDSTRTMITEIEVPNPDLKLVPGMYATVVLKVDQHSHALAIPIQAVTSTKAPTVLVLNQDNQIEERAVKLGLQTADRYEVLSGLAEGDLVVVGSRMAFQPGEKVEPKPAQIAVANEN